MTVAETRMSAFLQELQAVLRSPPWLTAPLSGPRSLGYKTSLPDYARANTRYLPELESKFPFPEGLKLLQTDLDFSQFELKIEQWREELMNGTGVPAKLFTGSTRFSSGEPAPQHLVARRLRSLDPIDDLSDDPR